MELLKRIEYALHRALEESLGHEAPPGLARALYYSVFPAGGRVRPRICLEVARACSDSRPGFSDAAAVSLELIHCGSLVHDDLPCFDDADCRRARPSVHKAFGEANAVLAGDALIVMAFDWLVRECHSDPDLLLPLHGELARATGAGSGIIAGQALESEPDVDPSRVHRAKTAAMFEAATVMGAISAGADGEAWRACGTLLGQAYQVADDIADVAGDWRQLGKPTGRDEKMDRPSIVRKKGLEDALGRLDGLIESVVSSIPPCANRDSLSNSFSTYAGRLCPPQLRNLVAQAAV